MKLELSVLKHKFRHANLTFSKFYICMPLQTKFIFKKTKKCFCINYYYYSNFFVPVTLIMKAPGQPWDRPVIVTAPRAVPVLSRSCHDCRSVPGLSPACPRVVTVLFRCCHDECDRNEKITVSLKLDYKSTHSKKFLTFLMH